MPGLGVWSLWSQAKILQCPCRRGLHVTLLLLSSRTDLENDCLNEHNTAVTGGQLLGAKRDPRERGGKAIAAGGCGSQLSLFSHLLRGVHPEAEKLRERLTQILC